MLPADCHCPVLPPTACPLLINTSLAPSPAGGWGTEDQQAKPDSLVGKRLLSVSRTGAHQGLFAGPHQTHQCPCLLPLQTEAKSQPHSRCSEKQERDGGAVLHNLLGMWTVPPVNHSSALLC